jgi:2,3-bisphosphoglycerate-independent phosphoglycerate mutase
MKPIGVRIYQSKTKGKKLSAMFMDKDGKTKVVQFGASGMSDFTKHKDPKRKERYLKRHKKNENWNAPMTAGALSRWILWNKPTLSGSISDYRKRFKLKSI